MTKNDLERFENFLSNIDLEAHRHQYRSIKIVELDMPKSVQALRTLYGEYWEKRANWPDFDSFYAIYAASLAEALETWRTQALFSHETFYRGLPARIYRTWTSLLTQIQGAYVAETIYGAGNVRMNVSEDHRGKDLVIKMGEMGEMPIQIKKLSSRSEARPRTARERHIRLEYAVPAAGPLTPTGKASKPYADWERKWGDRLKRLDNGFIVFRKPMFELQNLLSELIEPSS